MIQSNPIQRQLFFTWLLFNPAVPPGAMPNRCWEQGAMSTSSECRTRVAESPFSSPPPPGQAAARARCLCFVVVLCLSVNAGHCGLRDVAFVRCVSPSLLSTWMDDSRGTSGREHGHVARSDVLLKCPSFW